MTSNGDANKSQNDSVIETEIKGKLIESKPSNFLRTVADYLGLTLLKDLIYLNTAIGFSFGLFSDNMFFTLLPIYLMELGFSNVMIK